MNFLETLQELLLALFIAILLPVTLYWGISCVYTNPNYKDFEIVNSEITKEIAEKLQAENYQKSKDPFDNAVFYSAITVGFVSIISGAFIAINSLAIGLVAGGFISIFMGLAYSPGVAIFNFGILLFLFSTIISITVIKKKSQNII